MAKKLLETISTDKQFVSYNDFKNIRIERRFVAYRASYNLMKELA